MRSIRLRILAILAVLVIAGVVAWQLLPSDEVKKDPVAVGTTDVVTSLDPAGAYDAGSWAMYSNIYQSLMTFKSGAVVPEPDAAESCGFIGQKLQTYQCKLRDDLTFSNGRKITAEDVKYSIERMIRIKTDVGPWVLFPSLKNVVADGRTVTFNLTSRDDLPAEARYRSRFDRRPRVVPGRQAPQGEHGRRLGTVRPEVVPVGRDRGADPQHPVQGRGEEGGRPGHRALLPEVQ